MNPEPIDISQPNLLAEPPLVHLRGRSFEDREEIVPTLLNTMASCGCWLLERRESPPNAIRAQL